MWLVQTKFNMSGQRVNEVSADRLVNGRKHFLQSVMVSVAISKLGKTDVLVQPGAKINCLLLWERTQTRFTAGNLLYLELRLRVPAGWSACTLFTPHCRLPVFQCSWVHWTKKLATKQSGSKSRGLFSVESVVADRVSSQNFRHYSAEASFDPTPGLS